MIKYFEGTVFNVDADAIVNTINCIGVMNAGIALEFGLRYPDLLKEYEIKCKNKEINIGKIYYYHSNDKTIVNFPTKWHFKYPSKLEWIEAGLKNFVQTYNEHNMKSVAFTKLGTLNGKLDWKEVKKLMEKYLSDLDLLVYICLDNKTEAEGLEKQMLNFFNECTIDELAENVKLNTTQKLNLASNKPFTRFWRIKEIDGLGTTTYKNIFKYCYNQINNRPKIKQMSIFDLE